MKLQEIRESALALPRRSREKLAQALSESVMSEQDLDILYSRGKFRNPPGSEKSTLEWKKEIKKRLAALESGKDKSESWESVQAWMKERITGAAYKKMS